MTQRKTKPKSYISLSSYLTKSGHHKDWNLLRHRHYRQLMIEQMGMDAYDGHSICPQDISLKDIIRHHFYYNKWSIDSKDLVLLSQINHGKVRNPSAELTSYFTYFPLMFKQESLDWSHSFESNKDSFLKGEPPANWSLRLKQKYYNRKAFYQTYGFRAFYWFSQNGI